MNKYKDTDLREAFRRKYADEPQLPADFMAGLEQRMNQVGDIAAESDGETTGNKRRPLWRWVAVAACFLIIIGIGVHYQFEEPVVTSDVTLGNTARYLRQQAPLPKVTSEPTSEPLSAAQNSKPSKPIHAPSPVRTRRTETSLTKVQSVALQSLPTEKDSAPYGKTAASYDQNLHYASITTVDDTVKYQAPSRVDEFIAKMAEYNKVKEAELRCSIPLDSNVVSRVYVFPDKQEIDVFGRLLQVACSYSDAMPGYHLYFSHLQFFFELQDVRKHLQYRWIAERVNGKILLYSTNAPLGVNTSSACYQEYRDELMHAKIINTKTKEI